jgi:Zinc knuckle
MGDTSATVQPLQATPPVSYAATLKKTIQTFALPNPFPASEAPLPDRIEYSYSANAVIADFSGFETSKLETLNFLYSSLKNVEGLKFMKQGKCVEVAFMTEEEADTLLESGLVFQDRQLPITRAFHPDKSILSVTVHGLPFKSKEETYYELIHAFAEYADVSHIKYHFYDNTTIRMDSCNVILDFSLSNTSANMLPRQIPVFGKLCDLFWYNAPKFCRYCKTEGHIVRECPKLSTSRPVFPPVDRDMPSREDRVYPTPLAAAFPRLQVPIQPQTTHPLEDLVEEGCLGGDTFSNNAEMVDDDVQVIDAVSTTSFSVPISEFVAESSPAPLADPRRSKRKTAPTQVLDYPVSTTSNAQQKKLQLAVSGEFHQAASLHGFGSGGTFLKK